MSMVTLLKDALEVARSDISASLRTRRALSWALIYLACSTLGSLGYMIAISRIEAVISSTMQGGGLMQAMLRGEAYRNLVKGFFKVDSYDFILSLPPMVLYIAWASMTFLPWVVAFTSYDQVAEDVERGTVRYAVLRTSRFAFVLGKLLSQQLLLLSMLLISLIAPILLNIFYLKSFQTGQIIASLFGTVPLVFCYVSAFLGLFSLASQLGRRASTARGYAFGLLFFAIVVSLLDALTKPYFFGPYISWLRFLAPSTYKAYLFEGLLYERVLAALICVVMGFIYSGVGYLHFRRKAI